MSEKNSNEKGHGPINRNKKMGRPSKLEKLAAAHPKSIKGVKTIVKPASKEAKELVLKVAMDFSKNGGKVADACKRCGCSTTTFYYHVKRYPECREIAQKYGLGIKGDHTIQVVNAKPTLPKDDESAFSIFDLPTRKAWTTEEKQNAIRKTMEALKVGVPFGFAVRYAGIDKKRLTEWVTDEPGLLDVLLQAEAEWSVTFFRCLTKAAVVAADKGKFLEIVQGAERRFASQWGQVQAVDLTVKREDGSVGVISLDKNTIDTQFEKELQAEIKEEKKWER
jgi:hypothetical protein